MSKSFVLPGQAILFLFFLLLSVASAGKISSQTLNDLNLENDWEWEDLINVTIDISPPAAPLVQQLKDNINIKDARYLFKELAGLDSLQMLNELPEFALKDDYENRSEWFDLLTDSLKNSNLYFEDGFIGLLNAAVKLSNLRKCQEIPVSVFKNMDYLPQPVERSNTEINLNFNYDPAVRILSLYLNKADSNDEIITIAGSDVFKDICNSSNDLTENNIIRFLNISLPDPGYLQMQNIYKWINTASYLHFGGVSIYADSYERVIRKIKLNEDNMRLSFLKKISQFIPGDTSLNINVIFIFGNTSAAAINNKNIYISLEYFADDYEYLTEKIMHELFRIVHNEVLLKESGAWKTITNKDDLKLSGIMDEIYKNGLANYAGPFGSQTRPSSLLEKDFELFNHAFDAIYDSEDEGKADTLIRIGFSGISPFYTMGTQMAYIIENTLGKRALMQTIRHGSYLFFKKYIEAYNNSPGKIREVFQFNGDLEKKIFEFNTPDKK